MPSVVQQVMAAVGGKAEALIDRTLGTNIGDLTNGGGLAAGFNGNTNQAATACARKTSGAIGYLGKTLAAPAVFSRAIVHGSNDIGFIDIVGRTVALTVYGKQGSAPSGSLDGTNIGSVSFADTANESGGREIISTDLVTAWDHIWVRTAYGGGSPTPTAVNIAELVLYEVA